MNKADVGRRIRSWMVDAGMNAEDTAEALGVSVGSLKSWIYGQRGLYLDRAVQICELFDKPLDELACRKVS